MTEKEKKEVREALTVACVWALVFVGIVALILILAGCLKTKAPLVETKAPLVETKAPVIEMPVASKPQTASNDTQIEGDGNKVTTVNVQMGTAYFGAACMGFAAWRGVRYRQATDRMVRYVEECGPECVCKLKMKAHHDAVESVVHSRVVKLTKVH